MAKIIRPANPDLRYEPPLSIGWGIDSSTVERPRLTMSRTVIPPGGRNQRHYHVKCDAGMHILRGSLRYFFGPSHEQIEAIAEAGDFIFIPQGEIHGLMNVSDTEPAEIVTCYGGAGSKDEAQTVFVEPPWD